MMFRYESYLVALSISIMLTAGFSSRASAQPDPLGACCHEETAQTEISSKTMLLNFCDVMSEINCTEPDWQGQWFGAGTACGAGPGPFDDLTLCSLGIITLPVELTRFDALVNNGSILLVWATASETDNAGFSIEHEVGTDHFAEIGYVEGHGSTDEAKEYSFAVNELDPGVHRFRLRQIDFDGAFEYSPVVEAALTVPDRFLIEPAYPNPFNPTTTLRFAVAAEQQIEVRLVNSAGQSVRTLFTGTVSANEMQTITINADALSSGTYLVQFRGDNGLEATESIVLTK